MSKPYDAVTKRLIEMRPADWVAFLRLPEGDVSLVDADLSTITSHADRIIRVDTPGGVSYLVHNELESGKDTADVPIRLFHYNAAVLYKTRLPVVSTVFLLHKGANSPQITGTFPFSYLPGTEDQDAPEVRAIADAAKKLVTLRDNWLNPEGATATDLKTLP